MYGDLTEKQLMDKINEVRSRMYRASGDYLNGLQIIYDELQLALEEKTVQEMSSGVIYDSSASTEKP